MRTEGMFTTPALVRSLIQRRWLRNQAPHPAVSPFYKRASKALGIEAFEVYTVELPPNAKTVGHDHLDDGVEDLYFIR